MQDRSQKEVLRDIFEEKGITNHVQATYYNKLGAQILDKGPKDLKELFPVTDGTKQSDEWKLGYSLVLDYLSSKNMQKTKDTSINFVSLTPESKGSVVQKLGLSNNTQTPLSDIIRDQKMYLLFKSDDFDYDLPPTFYQSK